MAEKLVAYFSATGTTRKVAEKIAAETGADIFEIEPAEKYTKADLNWLNKNSRSSVEMRDRSVRPALAPKPVDLAPYKTVFLGFPIWWYTAPTLINVFLESVDTSGKRIVLFATSGSSGFGMTARELAPSAPQAEIVEGAVVRGLFAARKLAAVIALGEKSAD